MNESVEKNDEAKPASKDGFRREYAYKRPWSAIPLGLFVTFFIFYTGIGNIVAACVIDDCPIPFPVRLGCIAFGTACIFFGCYCLRDTIRLIRDRKKELRIVLTGTSFASPQMPMRSKHFTTPLSEIGWIRLVDWYGKKTLKIRSGRRRAVIPENVLTSSDLIEPLAADLAEASGMAVERREYRPGQFSLRTILIVITAVAVVLGTTAYFVPDSSGTRLLALWGMALILYSPALVIFWAVCFGRRPLRRAFAVGYVAGIFMEGAGQSCLYSQNTIPRTWPPDGWYPFASPLMRLVSSPMTAANHFDADLLCHFAAYVISGLLYGLVALFLWRLISRWRRRYTTGKLDHGSVKPNNKSAQ